MKKQDIVVHIKDEQMLNEAREILESVGEKIFDEEFYLKELECDNFLYKGLSSGIWWIDSKFEEDTEITLSELKELLK